MEKKNIWHLFYLLHASTKIYKYRGSKCRTDRRLRLMRNGLGQMIHVIRELVELKKSN